MGSWDDTLRELQVIYVGESLARLVHGDTLLERLTFAASDRDALLDLCRLFHAFAGAGATYGFPKVSALGRDGEQACSAVLDGDETPTAEVIGHWRALVVAMRAELSR